MIKTVSFRSGYLVMVNALLDHSNGNVINAYSNGNAKFGISM
jgi:hypothetical protein